MRLVLTMQAPWISFIVFKEERGVPTLSVDCFD